MIQQRTFWTEPPTHVRVYPCPACQETIAIDAPSCRFCHVTSDVKVAEKLWTENQQVTSAVSRAKTFIASSRAAIPLTGIPLWILVMSGGLSEICIVFNLLALSYGAQWLNHNSSLVTADAEYVEAVAKVKLAMVIWAIALLFIGMAYLALNGLPDLEMILEMFVVE